MDYRDNGDRYLTLFLDMVIVAAFFFKFSFHQVAKSRERQSDIFKSVRL